MILKEAIEKYKAAVLRFELAIRHVSTGKHALAPRQASREDNIRPYHVITNPHPVAAIRSISKKAARLRHRRQTAKPPFPTTGTGSDCR